MHRRFSTSWTCIPAWLQPILLVCAIAGVAAADDPTLPNLLRLPSARLEYTTALANDRDSLRTLTDDDPTTSADISATVQAPLDVVYSFAGATVAPERLVLRLPAETPKGAGTARVEILVSMVSAHAGFQSLRGDPLAVTAEPQEFNFAPRAARWVMLRFTPARQADRVSIADVALFGRNGAPQSNYLFKQTPADAIKVLAKLKQLSALDVTISRDEAAMLASVENGQFTDWTFAEAALLASGVDDGTKRRALRDRIDKLEVAARKAVSGARTSFAKGEKLLKWLHATVLTGGYESGQTSLAGVLETGKYNCVSSAVIYNVLSRRLGLDARAIEVPDHAFAIVYDGTEHADVETTTAGGFNPGRDPATREQLKEKTGFNYVPDSHRDQRREIGETGLVGIIFYNRGVGFTQDKRYPEALLAYFRAMSLDPEFASAVKNALSVLANWGLDLASQDKYAEGIEVLNAGLELAPEDATLLHNRKVFFSKWADITANKGDDDEALRILREAAVTVPSEANYFLAQQPWVYIRGGEARITAGEWDKALAAVEPGLRKLDKQPLEELREWRGALYLRWAQSLLEKNNFEQAVKVLQQGRKLNPGDSRYYNSLCFALQNWVQDIYDTSGEKAAKDVLQNQVRNLRGVAEIPRVARNHVYRIAGKLRDDQKFEAALAFVDRHAEFLPEKAEVKELWLSIIDAWARQVSQEKDWEQALIVYDKGLKRWPGDDHLKQNLLYTIQEGAKEIDDRAGEAKGREFLDKAASRFPKLDEVGKIAQARAGNVAESLAAKGEFKEALAAVQRNAKSPDEKSEVQKQSVRLIDLWAASFTKKMDWEQAIDVYAQGLARFPEDEHLQNNLIYTMQEGLKEIYVRAGEAKAREFIAQLIKRFPKLDDVDKIIGSHVNDRTKSLAAKGEFKEALALVERYAKLFKEQDAVLQQSRAVYDAWAASHVKQKEWQQALDVYAAGLSRFPKDEHLNTNSLATWDQWAKTFIDKQQWKQAIDIYENALKRHPDDSTLTQNLAYCKQKKDK